MSDSILYDTTLAAIVRDEEDNPAHGVDVWLRATLPYVERAVIVDTGSIDRTREVLEEVKRHYDHLEVFSIKFDDFATSRNFSLEKVKTKRVLILDADELLLPEEYERLNKYIQQVPARGYHFTFKQIFPTGSILNTMWDMQIGRLFNVEGAVFMNSRSNGIYEGVKLPNQERGEFPFVPVDIAIIKHFLPSIDAHKNKTSLWYGQDQIHQSAPLCHAKTYGWKERNGGRYFYYNSESFLKENFPKLVGDGR